MRERDPLHDVLVFIFMIIDLLAIFIFSAIGFGFVLKMVFATPIWVGCMIWAAIILFFTIIAIAFSDKLDM